MKNYWTWKLKGRQRQLEKMLKKRKKNVSEK